MKRLSLLTALLLFVTGASFFAPQVKFSAFTVDPQGNDILLTWQVSVEEDVRVYEVQRRSRFSNNTWVKVADVAPRGSGNTYQYRDDQVYKAASEQVDYQVDAVFNDGTRASTAVKQINYTPTAVRRTWGSIKAMFQ
jgi:hypothetical protein